MSDLERYRAFARLCRDMAMSQTDARERDRLLQVCSAWDGPLNALRPVHGSQIRTTRIAASSENTPYTLQFAAGPTDRLQ